MTKKAFNENYRHSCDEIQISFADRAKTISAMYSAEETSRLMGFYLCIGPNESKNAPTTTIRSLADYGWRGTAQLAQLERKLLASSGIGSFCMLNSAKIDMTLEAMNLTDKICPNHPRAVIQRTITNLQYREDGSLQIKYQDANRMQCLLRHIRNSFAHGLTYQLTEGSLLLEDRNTKHDQNITARILVKKQTLIDWMDIIEKGLDKS